MATGVYRIRVPCQANDREAHFNGNLGGDLGTMRYRSDGFHMMMRSPIMYFHHATRIDAFTVTK